MLLVCHGHPTMEKYRHENLGRLIQPRHYSSVEVTSSSGVPWAADNDAFNGGFDEVAFTKMLDRIAGLPGCLFVSAPDVVADGPATRRLFWRWRDEVHSRGLPVAMVMQDGMTPGDLKANIDAVFIGGTTEFKLGPMARRIVAAAKWRGLWVHMGRVNSRKRARYAASIGCDSIDGTAFSRFPATYIPKGLDWVSE